MPDVTGPSQSHSSETEADRPTAGARLCHREEPSASLAAGPRGGRSLLFGTRWPAPLPSAFPSRPAQEVGRRLEVLRHPEVGP